MPSLVNSGSVVLKIKDDENWKILQRQRWERQTADTF